MCSVKYIAKANMESYMLQILVVVANIHMRAFKTEVGGAPGEQ